MQHFSNPAPYNQIDNSGPHALVISEYPEISDTLIPFLRESGVVVITELRGSTLHDFEYALFIGDWEMVKQNTAQNKESARKIFCICIGEIPQEREVNDFLAKNRLTKVIFFREADVTHINCNEAFSFFFSRALKRAQFAQKTNIVREQTENKISHKKNLLSFFETSLPSESVGFVPPEEAPKKSSHFQFPKRARYVFATSFLFFVLVLGFTVYPIASAFTNYSLALFSLRTSLSVLSVTDPAERQEVLKKSSQRLEEGARKLSQISWMFPSQFKNTLQSVMQGTTIAREAVLGVHAGLSAVSSGETGLRSLTSGGESFAQTLENVREMVSLSNTHFALAQAESSVFLENYPPLLNRIIPKARIEGYITRMNSTRQTISFFNGLLTLAPEVLGFSGKKTYLLVFQNNMELRPTGGFIGSYGLVTFEQGKMGPLVVEDVYTADGQLKGHVEPPFAIKTFLGQEHWYMRDSNWDPDFGKSGERLAWFLEKETGTVVDGVIALDVSALGGLLRATGPVDLPDYNLQITSDNLVTQTQLHAQSDFFPGSTQKRDFLGALSRSLLVTLTQSTSALSYPRMLEEVQRAFQEKHILIYMKDGNQQALVERLGIGGQIGYERCLVSGCLSDVFYAVDSNLGVNKANAYVEKATTVETVFGRDGGVGHNIKILYHNSSPVGQTFPGGFYRNYARVLVPLGSTFNDVKLDTVSVSEKIKDSYKPKGLEEVYFIDQDGEYQVLEVFFEVPPSGSRVLTFSYNPPGQLQFGQDGASYVFTILKQPGTDNDLLYTSVSYPSFWHLTQNPTSTLAKEGMLEYNGRLLLDAHMKLRFVQ